MSYTKIIGENLCTWIPPTNPNMCIYSPEQKLRILVSNYKLAKALSRSGTAFGEPASWWAGKVVMWEKVCSEYTKRHNLESVYEELMKPSPPRPYVPSAELYNLNSIR